MALTAGIVGLPNVGKSTLLMQLQKQARKLQTILSQQLTQMLGW